MTGRDPELEGQFDGNVNKKLDFEGGEAEDGDFPEEFDDNQGMERAVDSDAQSSSENDYGEDEEGSESEDTVSGGEREELEDFKPVRIGISSGGPMKRDARDLSTLNSDGQSQIMIDMNDS